MLTGTRIHWVWQDSEGEGYHHESVFVSKELYEQYGRYAFYSQECGLPEEAVFDALNTVSEDTIPEEIAKALQQEGVPDNEWSETLPSDVISHSVLRDSDSTIYYTTHTSSAKIKPLGGFAQDESNIRSSEPNLSNQAGSPDYSGPLFVYELDSDPGSIDDGTLVEQRGPINASWKQSLGKQANNVESEMGSNGWNFGVASVAPVLSGDRYVIIDDNSSLRFKNQDGEAGKQTGIMTAQYHVRLYDIPDAMDAEFQVAGQAHEDPTLHSQASNPIWNFSQSRDEVGSDWQNWGYQASTVQIGNQDSFQSSNGDQDQIQ